MTRTALAATLIIYDLVVTDPTGKDHRLLTRLPRAACDDLAPHFDAARITCDMGMIGGCAEGSVHGNVGRAHCVLIQGSGK